MPDRGDFSGRIIALTGQKGGVGKSTTAICLAAATMQRGLRVLLV
jgi:chromosome partitioning protein